MNSAPELFLGKGLGPAFAKEHTAKEIIGTSLFAENREFPQLSLNDSALTQNIAAMAEYTKARGVHLAPHGKTAMSVELAERQLKAGAWAITAATPTQLRVYRHFGISRLYLANQLVEPSAIAWLRNELAADPAFECFITVDSAAGLQLLADTSAESETRRPIDVMLELGHVGGRTGTRSAEELIELARTAKITPGVRVAGVTNYEGTLGGATPVVAAERVYDFACTMASMVAQLENEHLVAADCWVSIGGSAYFDEAFRGLTEAGNVLPNRIVLRSGAYLTYDNGLYARTGPAAREISNSPKFASAIRVWAPVLSMPEPGLALLLCGRRDVGFDADLPAVLGVRARNGDNARAFSGTITQLADQHAFVSFDPTKYDAQALPRVGELVELGVSHPCTTLDRWGLVPVVDDQFQVCELTQLHFV
ncbi:alanine racemase [Leucobacter sp. UT-8R-CII-1-4]|uniref:alanine racemase n=1 Tax=Leucobacter sp. UT-8R-CII-1-4 TaxID=3040075 RepID=UPI0024A9BE04|nr:alanine racemase [Leucobacter sp. UT-8R-CII-1-4]MDI6023545.1 alanine racemase [Leucobacter sp. UT-8R-CII-1-4]